MMLLTYWKQFAALSLFLAGAYLGYSYEHAKFKAFIAKVETEGKIAEALNAKKQQQQTIISNNIAKGYSDAVTTLNKHYANRLLNSHSKSSSMSEVSSTTETTDGKTEVITLDSTRDASVDCALDALQLIYLQSWIENQITIE
jgi:hypothetical protein